MQCGGGLPSRPDPIIVEHIDAITRHKLRKLLKYALATATVGGVLMLVAGRMDFAVVGAWGLLGAWTGVLEEFLFGRRFRSLAIPLQMLGKAAGGEPAHHRNAAVGLQVGQGPRAAVFHLKMAFWPRVRFMC
jgi:hypothetical protein